MKLSCFREASFNKINKYTYGAPSRRFGGWGIIVRKSDLGRLSVIFENVSKRQTLTATLKYFLNFREEKVYKSIYFYTRLILTSCVDNSEFLVFRKRRKLGTSNKNHWTFNMRTCAIQGDNLFRTFFHTHTHRVEFETGSLNDFLPNLDKTVLKTLRRETICANVNDDDFCWVLTFVSFTRSCCLILS